jgi:hypothetical protein
MLLGTAPHAFAGSAVLEDLVPSMGAPKMSGSEWKPAFQLRPKFDSHELYRKVESLLQKSGDDRFIPINREDDRAHGCEAAIRCQAFCREGATYGFWFWKNQAREYTQCMVRLIKDSTGEYRVDVMVRACEQRANGDVVVRPEKPRHLSAASGALRKLLTDSGLFE